MIIFDKLLQNLSNQLQTKRIKFYFREIGYTTKNRIK